MHADQMRNCVLLVLIDPQRRCPLRSCASTEWRASDPMQAEHSWHTKHPPALASMCARPLQRCLYIWAFAHGSANLKMPMQALALENACKFITFPKGFGFYKFKILAGWDKYYSGSTCFLVYKKENKHIFFTLAQWEFKLLKYLLSTWRTSNSFHIFC